MASFGPLRDVTSAGLAIALLLACSLHAADEAADWRRHMALVEELHQAGRDAEALEQAREALKHSERLFGTEHLYTALCHQNLGVLSELQGDAAAAEEYYGAALSVRQQARASQWELTESMERLADLYLQQGRYGEAANLYQRVVESRRRQLGGETLATSRPLNNLASIYSSRGEYDKAEPLFERALAALERDDSARGDLIVVLTNLSELQRVQGRWSQAEFLQQRIKALSAAEQRADGSESVTLSTTLRSGETNVRPRGLISRQLTRPPGVPSSHAGEAASGSGTGDEASPAGQAAQRREDDSPERETLRNDPTLPAVEALRQEDRLQQALTAAEQEFGPNHVKVAEALNELAGLYVLHHKPDHAVPLYERALVILERAHGPNHPSVVETVYRLAPLHASSQTTDADSALYRRYQQVLAMAAESLSRRAAIYVRIGRYPAAEELFVQSLAIYERTYGPDHPDIALLLDNYAQLLKFTGRLNDAETLQKRARAIREGRPSPQPLVAPAAPVGQPRVEKTP